MKRMRLALTLFTATVFCCAGCADWLNQRLGFITSEVSNFSVKMMGLQSYQGTSFCIPEGENYSFAVALVKGDKEKRTDFVAPSRSQLLTVQTKTSYHKSVLVIPPAGNATDIYISFDGKTSAAVPKNMEYDLPSSLSSFTLTYWIEGGKQVTSAPYYKKSQGEFIPKL